jgi:DNA-binding NtrC family response regulator
VKTSIIYLDDEPDVLEVFLDSFAGEYNVRVATTLAEARRTWAERQADIVISDQSMPEISGIEFLAEVARVYPKSYRVMLTGSMSVGEAIPELSSGAVHLFIAKPWSYSEMFQVIERASLEAYMRRLDG